MLLQLGFHDFLAWEQASRDTIDFKCSYVDMAEDVVAGLLLSQIIYWFLPDKQGRTKLRVRKDGYLWLAKNRSDWWAEIRLNPRQVDRAMGILKGRGIILVQNSLFNGKRTPFIRINEEIFLERWNRVVSFGVTVEAVLRNGNTDVTDSLHRYDETVIPLTETTTETTAETKIPAAPQRKTPKIPKPDDHELPSAEKQWEILFGKDGKRSKRSWSVPASAGGADSLGEALLPIFCQGVDFPVEVLSDKERGQWAAELRKVAEGRGVSVEQAVAALNAYFDPQGEFHWKIKSVSKPFQRGFQDDWDKLLARVVMGQPLKSSPKQEERRYGGRSDFPD